MKNETIEAVLEARAGVYRMLQLLCGTEPNEEILTAFFSGDFEDALACLRDAEPGFASAAEALAVCRATREGDRAAYLKASKAAYTRLFEGPGKLAAAPWGCVYLSGERMLFQESTLAVREAYRAEGMLTTGYPHVSDDHIAIELDFVGKLAGKCLGAYREEDDGEYRRLLGVQRAFLGAHMLTWTPSYARDLAQAAQGTLYEAAALLLDVFLAFDAALLAELEQER